MKLILLDVSSDTWYQITDAKYFEEEMAIDDLKVIYHEMIGWFYIQDILDNMETSGLIESVGLTDDEKKGEVENIQNYRYTMEYIKNILESKMSKIEFKTYIDWCNTEIENTIKKKMG